MLWYANHLFNWPCYYLARLFLPHLSFRIDRIYNSSFGPCLSVIFQTKFKKPDWDFWYYQNMEFLFDAWKFGFLLWKLVKKSIWTFVPSPNWFKRAILTWMFIFALFLCSLHIKSYSQKRTLKHYKVKMFARLKV